MKVLTATKETQGYRKSDFSATEDGELVGYSSSHQTNILIGWKTRKATTTFKVVDLPMTQEDLKNKLIESLVQAGVEREFITDVDEEVKALVEVAGYFNVGDVLERKGGSFRQRVLR